MIVQSVSITSIVNTLDMKLLIVTILLVICLGLGYSINIRDFSIDPFFSSEYDNHERQSTTEINSQIVPLFVFTFVASLVGNLISISLLNLINNGTEGNYIALML